MRTESLRKKGWGSLWYWWYRTNNPDEFATTSSFDVGVILPLLLSLLLLLRLSSSSSSLMLLLLLLRIVLFQKSKEQPKKKKEAISLFWDFGSRTKFKGLFVCLFSGFWILFLIQWATERRERFFGDLVCTFVFVLFCFVLLLAFGNYGVEQPTVRLALLSKRSYTCAVKLLLYFTAPPASQVGFFFFF